MSETPDVPHDPAQEVRVPADALRDLVVRMYVKMGMFKVEAEYAAHRQIESDLRGIHSHGTRATPRYLKAMDNGDIDPRGQTTVVKQTAAFAVLDGGRSMGHVSATRALKMAMDMAREVGTGTVAVKNSNHYGASSVYALMAAKEGMLCYTTTSTGGATVAAYGSRQAATANNAFAWGVPSRTGSPFCLDMACAVSSWGKLDSWKLYGQSMPAGWALDADGNPTTDPHASKVLLPAAGARGYGLAFLSSVLAGPLSGGKMPLHKTRHPDAEDSEHFFYVIDLKQFVDEDRFYAECDKTIAEIRALAPAEGFSAVTLPGDIESARAAEFAVNGIPLHRQHLRDLEPWAKKWKLDVPWEVAGGGV
jgi:LDH2 family malate/lactate/ureidoglycolate dehydrogenase